MILVLDHKTPTVGKFCKNYNTVARINLLSVKMSGPNLVGISGPKFYKEVIEESFKRTQEIKITEVQKNITKTWVWLVAPTPNQAEKLLKYNTAFRNAILPTTFKVSEKLSETQIAMKNCLMFVLQRMQLTKNMEETTHTFNALIGAKNVASHY